MHFSFVLLLLPSVLSFSTVHPKLLRIDRCFRITALRAPSSTQDIFSRNNVINRFTLEKPIYKPSVQSRIAWDRLPVAAASAVALTGIAVGSIRGARLAVHILFSRGTSVTSVDVDKKAVPYIQYSLWSAGAKLQHAISSAVESGYTAIKGKGNPVDLSIWSKATLLRATDLPGGYTRYRFNLESPDSYLPLDLGQEIVLSLVNSKDRVLKDNYFPASKLTAKGMFDIVSASSDLDSAVDSSLTPEEKFSRALLEMQPGDELAFRGGRHRLSGSSPLLRNRKAGARLSKSGEDAITKISVVATGQGITPSVQFIRYALDSLGSSNADDLPFGRPVVRANSCELLWLNEKEDDYTSENEIKDFEYRYGNRFKSSKVLESDLYSPDVVRNGNLRKYISEYTPGSIAVICAPEHLVEQFRFLYRELGYPVDSILSIMTN